MVGMVEPGGVYEVKERIEVSCIFHWSGAVLHGRRCRYTVRATGQAG